MSKYDIDQMFYKSRRNQVTAKKLATKILSELEEEDRKFRREMEMIHDDGSEWAKARKSFEERKFEALKKHLENKHKVKILTI